MSRHISIFIAFVIAVAATVLGWSQSMNYKITPVVPLAIWFPIVVLTGARDLGAVALSLIQFPLFATAFVIGVRRWPVVPVLAALLVIYGLLAASAYFVVSRR